MNLPENIKVNDFEDILNQLENEDDKNWLENIYEKNEDSFILNSKELDIEKSPENVVKLLNSLNNEQEPDENEDGEMKALKKEIQEQKNNIETLTSKIAEYEDLLRRKQAEFENFRKRSLREKEEFQKTANMKFIEELLPIIDNFEKALESKDNDNTDSLIDGIMLIEKQFKKVLEAHGVEIIKAVGEEFDPNLHEALHIDENNTDHEHDTVISEWAKGYMIHGKVIRHSKVAVAKGTGEPAQSN